MALSSILSFWIIPLNAQEVPILSYTTNSFNQIEIEVSSNASKYYTLEIKHHPDSSFALISSLQMGVAGTTILSESLENYPISHYRVIEHSVQSPDDVDQDGIDDITELQQTPAKNPINSAPSIDTLNGMIRLNQASEFKSIAIRKDLVQWNEYLNGKDFVKYIIRDFDTDHPKVYFINGRTHSLHVEFANALGFNHLASDVKKGHIIYHPSILANNGRLGSYSFNYSNIETHDFSIVQKTHELLAANMPFLQNNLSYYVNLDNEAEYQADKSRFDNSRVPILLESNVFAEIDYWGLNQVEGYGLFRQISLNDNPGARDIVLYDAIPNNLSRVGGIITSVIQTPLSHVNIRAIQDNIPNAFIRDPLLNDSISNLLNKYVYFKVEQGKYILREATIEEVNSWYEAIRPNSELVPPLNLSYTSILPLNEIAFSMFDGFGAKCANLATMRTFGFPENTIPNGFGIPFYFYQEFMKHNDFFEEIEGLLADEVFLANQSVRETQLKALRKKIEDASMPSWMLDSLSQLQSSFPAGTSIRCRSSTNNEDLPGFSGAGLYTSKTQKPSEGHISKSIKEVYASLWNLRAYEERAFFRVNHFTASMGVLCHPNFSDEKVNGVGVSSDPVYDTENTFYLNSQLGEDLITNPSANSFPEELLVNRDGNQPDSELIIRRSNLIPIDSLLMRSPYLEQMRLYLTRIHDEFEQLYKAEGNSTFAMDIEYKVTADDQLVIKQARPWVGYNSSKNYNPNGPFRNQMKLIPNPASEFVAIECPNCDISLLRLSDLKGIIINEWKLQPSTLQEIVLPIGNLAQGVYLISGFSRSKNAFFSERLIKN